MSRKSNMGAYNKVVGDYKKATRVGNFHCEQSAKNEHSGAKKKVKT